MANDDSNNMNYDSVILELQRIEELQETQEKLEKKISETVEEVDEMKSFTEKIEEAIGIDESDKKKNVIDGGKLSSTLTTSEKKRYENIGKEFVAGAGKELENVRSMILDPDHSKAASIVIDGILKAASETNLIYVFNTQSAADAFNSNLKIIETMIENILSKKYNVLSNKESKNTSTGKLYSFRFRI